MPRLKIAQVATADISVRFLLLDHLQALQQAGHDVLAVCSPGKWVEEVRAHGIRVETVAMARELSPLRDAASLRELARVFRREHCHVVHTHTPKAGLLGPVAARLAGVPAVVHTIHGLLFHDRMPRSRQRLMWLPERFTSAFATSLLSQSREDVDAAVSSGICRREKISYIGNGIDVRRFAPRAPEERHALRERLLGTHGVTADHFVVGCVGRLVYEKGFAELFAAAESLTKCRSPLKFLVVGPRETDQSDAVSPERIRELESRGAVIFAGWGGDMPEWYSVMDAFALPSHREGVPRAAMEAAAMEVPVIASDIRGCREVVLHERSGLLVPVRDARALAAAMERLSRDPAWASELGREGRRHIAKNFDRGLVLERLLRFYDAVEIKVARQLGPHP